LIDIGSKQRGVAGCGRGTLIARDDLAVNKVTWRQVGRVTEPGRYMFTFGWLTITAEDIFVWERYPNAAFTLIHTGPATATDAGEEFRLGAFDPSGRQPVSGEANE